MRSVVAPHPVGGPSSWRGQDLVERPTWLHHLSPAEVAEVDEALAVARESGKQLTDLVRDDFPLDRLAQRLGAVALELEEGLGFVLLRGLPIERYGLDEARVVFWGIGGHLGIGVSQNGSGDLVGDVRDEGAVPAGAPLGKNAARGYNSNIGLPYHSDMADVVGLMCLMPGRSGGISTVASSTRLHDELLREHPDLVPPLYEPQAHTNLQDVDEDQPPYQYTPTFSYFADRLSVIYKLDHIVHTHTLFPEFGPVDERIPRAQQFMDALAHRDHLDMAFQPGDMQFINNFSVVHSRTAFVDHDDPARRRHLLRLWLTPHSPRPLAPGFGWNAGLSDERGGRGGVWRRLPTASTLS